MLQLLDVQNIFIEQKGPVALSDSHQVKMKAAAFENEQSFGVRVWPLEATAGSAVKRPARKKPFSKMSPIQSWKKQTNKKSHFKYCRRKDNITYVQKKIVKNKIEK